MRQAGGTRFKHLYRTARWQRIRKAQLQAHPLCSQCQMAGRVTAATVCNHTLGHPADETEEMFWAGPFDSQCAACHSGVTARQERTGRIVGGDVGGWSLDPDSPWRAP